MILWNGPMGVFEIDAFCDRARSASREGVADSARTQRGRWGRFAGGCREGRSSAIRIDHLSTGGGASLEFVQGLTLPGVAALDRPPPRDRIPGRWHDADLPLVVGNWKMNGHAPAAAPEYASEAFLAAIAIESMPRKRRSAPESNSPSPRLPRRSELPCGTALSCGSGVAARCTEHVSSEGRGRVHGRAVDGADARRSVGCEYALVGHSERRQLFGEDDAFVAAKIKRLAASSLTPILCVGETLAEREAGQTLNVVRRQLSTALESVSSPATGPDDGLQTRLVVAYEPVWAIGTGKTATPEIAQSVHADIRNFLTERFGQAGDRLRILYGGSVKPSNAQELLAERDIDGALVGGASLDPKSFAQLVQAGADRSSKAPTQE